MPEVSEAPFFETNKLESRRTLAQSPHQNFNENPSCPTLASGINSLTEKLSNSTEK